MESRSDELYHVLCEKGYPDDFCKEIAYRQMNTDYTATRMLGYLYRVSNPRPEDVVDEMLAILTDREAIIQKKELYHVLCEKGYPDDFCKEIAYRQMNTDYTATRMLGYLYRVSNPRPEDVVDEMLAILTDREAIIQKKELEHAQATINHVYRKGL